MKEEEEFDENAITAVGDDEEDKDKEEKKEKVLVVKASVVAGTTYHPFMSSYSTHPLK